MYRIYDAKDILRNNTVDIIMYLVKIPNHLDL